jgi:hypothetical protein
MSIAPKTVFGCPSVVGVCGLGGCVFVFTEVSHFLIAADSMAAGTSGQNN